MTPREELVAALRHEDWDRVEALGWRDTFALLKRGWPKRLLASDLAVYATVLGHHDPQLVHEALIGLASGGRAEWRPSAAQLATEVTARRPRVAGQRKGRPDQAPAALATVRELLSRGSAVCACAGGRQFHRDPGGVMRCAACRGIEQGQADAAAELEDEAA
ncbi:hypothetical protein FSW04_17690 [Baekduia soli]|uniref:Uncharacterized protein n=1 Tax=Baekduia soli TaxID=496014 RepID=A0A5B8U8J0_9ACTN|nr:hypothetical protein [Baekduia soli]QEC49231.1 hypothetical protein FSW04_17690 [Baekduia soli]